MSFYEAGSLYPNGPSGSTGMVLTVIFFQAPGAAPLSALVRNVLAPGSPGARAILASMARTSGYACTGCDILNATWSFIEAYNCFPPTCFPPGTSSFEPPAAPTPTPSPTPNVASATITMGSVTLSVVGLPSAACAAAESACLQAVINALTALLPPTAPAAKGGVAITKYYDAGGGVGTTFEASFAVLQAAGALVAVPATVRGGLGAGTAGAAALAASIAQATGSRAAGLSVAVLSVQSADYGGAGAGGGGSGGGGGGGGGGVTAATIVLIVLFALQCVVFPAVLLKCYLRHATISLPPVLMSLFGLTPRSFNSLDEGATGAAAAKSADFAGSGAAAGYGSNAASASEGAAVAVAPADVEVVASAAAEATN